MTVFVYINTAKDVGDIDYLKVFANREAAERWFPLEKSTLRRSRKPRMPLKRRSRKRTLRLPR